MAGWRYLRRLRIAGDFAFGPAEKPQLNGCLRLEFGTWTQAPDLASALEDLKNESGPCLALKLKASVPPRCEVPLVRPELAEPDMEWSIGDRRRGHLSALELKPSWAPASSPELKKWIGELLPLILRASFALTEETPLAWSETQAEFEPSLTEDLIGD